MEAEQSKKEREDAEYLAYGFQLSFMAVSPFPEHMVPLNLMRESVLVFQLINICNVLLWNNVSQQLLAARRDLLPYL